MDALGISINVAIADEQTLFRTGLTQLLSSQGNYNVILEAQDAIGLIRNLRRSKQKPDVLLLNSGIPKQKNMDLLKELKTRWPKIKILMLSAFAEEYSAIQAIRQGAHGFVLKNSDLEEFNAALSAVAGGKIYVDKALYSEYVADHIEHKTKRMSVRLTKQQKQFLSLCLSEKTYYEIAEIMGKKPRTVDGYREDVCKMLRVHTRTGLVMFAIRAGFVSPLDFES